MDALSDEDLVERSRQSSPPGSSEPYLNELFRRYHTRVALWCLRFTGDRESAADLAQEIFLKAYRNLDSFRGDAKFSTWLYVIARNHCRNELQARARQLENFAGEEPLDLAISPEPSAHARLEQESSLRLVQALMNEALDETERRVMTMHYGEELPLEAVTRLLGLTNASGAKAHIVSARRKLSTALARWKAAQARR